jgi:hypothetical protein
MIKTDKNIRSSHKFYKQNVEKVHDVKTYISIINGLNKFIMQNVLEGYEVVLPARMGIMSIIGTKQKISFDKNGNPILPPDWVKTKELWDRNPEAKERKQLVYHTNEHTGGIRYKLFWSKEKMLVENKGLYNFRLTRENKRAINHKVTVEKKEYFVKNK